MTIIYISHRLHELLYLGDQFTVLRCGHIVGEAPRALVDRRWIVERMSGRTSAVPENHTAHLEGSEVLAVSHLSVPSRRDETTTALDDISFSLDRGEILGIYGLLGSGRTELLETIAGARPFSSGQLTLKDRPLALRSVADAVESGIVMVPEDRQRDGLILDLSIRENIAISSLNGLFIDRRKQAGRSPISQSNSASQPPISSSPSPASAEATSKRSSSPAASCTRPTFSCSTSPRAA